MPDYANPYRGFNVLVSGERGSGTMVAILSDGPLTTLDLPDAPKTYGSQDEALAFIERLRKDLTRNLSLGARADGGGGKKPGWSIDMSEYIVQ